MVLLVALVALAPTDTSFNPKNIRKWLSSLKETHVDMANAKQNYRLSNRRNTKTVTEDDIDILLKLTEVYYTAYDLEAAEWFWREYNREVTSFEELETSILIVLKEPNSLKDLHQNSN
jgi:hypothetical protein